MKKMFFLCTFICATVMVFSQAIIPESEVMRIVNANKEMNKKAGVYNPDTIRPGQKLSYDFSNGKHFEREVKVGDYQIKIVREILAMEDEYGKVVSGDNSQNVPAELNRSNGSPVNENYSANEINWLYALLILIFIIALIFNIFSILKKRKKARISQQWEKILKPKDPKPTLTDLVPGGIPDTQAPQHMQMVAQRMGPHVRIVGPTVKGKVTTPNGPIEVSYVEGTQMETYENEPFFRALAEIDNGEAIYLYFRQSCGNDAKAGRIMGGTEIIFIPDPIQSSELQEANTMEADVLGQPNIVTKANNPVPTNDLVGLATAVGNALSSKENGKFSITVGEVKIEGEFSKTLIADSNHVRKDPFTITTEEKTAQQ